MPYRSLQNTGEQRGAVSIQISCIGAVLLMSRFFRLDLLGFRTSGVAVGTRR